MNKSAIIIDNGACSIKVGLSGDENPRLSVRTVIGEVTNSQEDCSSFLIGDKAFNSVEYKNLTFPIRNGYINDWDAIEFIWDSIFTEVLKINPAEHVVLLTEAALIPKNQREKMAQIMFEKFQFSGIVFELQTVLSLSYLGKMTGIVVDSGETMTQIVPILNAYPLSGSINSFYIGGNDVSNYLAILLKTQFPQLGDDSNKEIIRNIKEKSCYIALNPEDEVKTVQKTDYTLPDGTNISFTEPRFKATEVLFNPGLVEKEAKGLDLKILDSITKTGPKTAPDMFENIILSGGNTLFPGIKDRLTREFKKHISEKMKEKIRIIDDPHKGLLPFKGASIFASVSAFESKIVHMKDFKELGNKATHRRSSLTIG